MKHGVVTLSLKRTVFEIFDFEKSRDLKMWVKGHARSLEMSPFDRPYMTLYNILTFYSNHGSMSCRF